MSERIKNRINKVNILDKDELYRRIHPNHHINERISSAAFRSTRAYCISVDIAKLTTPKKSIGNHIGYWLSSILAGFVRGLELDVHHDPEPENYAHGMIEGNITKAKSKKLAKEATIILRKDKKSNNYHNTANATPPRRPHQK